MKMNNNNNSNNYPIRGEEEGVKGFYACYILTSLSPRHKGHTYIGYTVNPRRRIRQHNGEIVSGAFRTKRKRPWEMVLCIYGFPTNVSALQFEWAWQHPTESIAVKKAAASFKTLGGLGNKVKLAFTMLTLSRWQDLDLTVNFFSSKYTKHSAGCPTLPKQMSVQVCSMDDLPCYTGIYSTPEDEYEDEDEDEDRDDLDVGGDLVDETDIIGKYTEEVSANTTGKTGSTDASINEGLMNIPDNNDRYGRTTSYGGSSDNFVNDSDHLFSWTEKIECSFDLGLENGIKDNLDRSSINVGSPNIPGYDDLCGRTTIYRGINNNFLNKSDFLFKPTENNYIFNVGIKVSPEDDLTRYGDLYSSIGVSDRFGSTEDDRVEIDQPNKETITRKGVCNYQPAANSPITSQQVEVIDLSTPSPGYGVGLKGKRRKVSGGVIDLTNSLIFC